MSKRKVREHSQVMSDADIREVQDNRNHIIDFYTTTGCRIPVDRTKLSALLIRIDGRKQEAFQAGLMALPSGLFDKMLDVITSIKTTGNLQGTLKIVDKEDYTNVIPKLEKYGLDSNKILDVLFANTIDSVILEYLPEQDDTMIKKLKTEEY